MTTRRRLDPDQRRNQILVAATGLFRRDGYAGVSLENVAEAAGVTRGLLHHYFGSKRDLFVDVVRHAVRIPPEIEIVPRDLTGDFPTVIAACVDMWMTMTEASGGLWTGVAMSDGIAGADIDAVLDEARDVLVERMIDEVPFPTGLDPDHLRSALRCFAAMARVATDEWLVHHALDRRETAALLTHGLVSLVEVAVPAMER